MQAFQFVAAQQPAELREVPVPEPGPGQVLVKIGGAGACHSDLHILEAPPASGLARAPFPLGHENAGWVEKLGPGTTGFAPGDPVIVYGPWGCGLCMNCRMGKENYCQNRGDIRPGGLGVDGGMAPYLLVPSTRFLIPLGTLDPREAAPLSDAALTSYHAVKRSLHVLGAGSTAVVIGAGGLRQMAIPVLRVPSGATTVIAVDTAADKLEIARQMGADDGKSLWRTYVIPAPGEKGNDTWAGDTWKNGGGAVWLTGTYDPDTNLLYFGTGNPAPWI